MYRDIKIDVRRQTMIFRAEWLDWIMENNNIKDKLNVLTKLIEFGLTGKRPRDLEGSEDIAIEMAEAFIYNDYQRFADYIKKKNAERMMKR